MFLNRNIIHRLNEMGRTGHPFLFIIDYEGQEAYIRRLDQISQEECLYDIDGISNAGEQSVADAGQMVWSTETPSYREYKRSFDIVRRNIYAGNSYLANLTCAIPVHTNLSLGDLFYISRARYRLMLAGRFVCFSPETFIRIHDGRIYSFPMKGTIDASLPDAEQRLMDDPKEAAEHATITDLIRNDLSRVASDVRVDRYRYVERLENTRGGILQTSSQISGRLPDDYTSHIGDILSEQLPAGSITGAPKDKTVNILHEAETHCRGFYTGVAGIHREGTLDSAVMIRFIEQDGSRMTFKAGGGITAKSDCRKEYEEVIQKTYVPIR